MARSSATFASFWPHPPKRNAERMMALATTMAHRLVEIEQKPRFRFSMKYKPSGFI
jgi:hypothetical protein